MTKSFNDRRIYGIRFLSNFCQSLFFPFFAVWLLKGNIVTSSAAAVIVSAGILATRFSAVGFSWLFKRFHFRQIIIFALIVLLCSYCLFYSFAIWRIHHNVLWVMLSVLTGSAISMNSLALLSCVVENKNSDHNQKQFSIMNMVFNLSGGLGPLFGGMALSIDAKYFPLVPALFAFISLIMSLKLENKSGERNPPLLSNGMKLALGGSDYLYFILLNIVTLFAYAQFYDLFPVIASHYFSVKTIGFLFLLSSIVIVLSQMPMHHFLQRYDKKTALQISHIMLGMGTLLFIGMAHHQMILCVIGVIVISIAEVMYAPLYQALAVQFFKPSNAPRALAFQGVSWGVAEAVASFVGIHLVSHGKGMNSFVLGGVIAIMVCIAVGYVVKE